jgi:thiamine pyrophosphokinase
MINKFMTCCKSVLVLDGNISSIQLIKQYKRPIIAADGAANKLLEIGIVPDIVIGDLDSIDISMVSNFKIEIIEEPNQNESDFQKAMTYVTKKELVPPVIIGMNGGHMDHILNNVSILAQNKCIFLDYPIIGFTLEANDSISLSLPTHTKISIIGLSNCLITTHGLKWELNCFLLNFARNTSCFNRSIGSTVEIEMHQGQALIMLYLESVIDCAVLGV